MKTNKKILTILLITILSVLMLTLTGCVSIKVNNKEKKEDSKVTEEKKDDEEEDDLKNVVDDDDDDDETSKSKTKKTKESKNTTKTTKNEINNKSNTTTNSLNTSSADEWPTVAMFKDIPTYTGDLKVQSTTTELGETYIITTKSDYKTYRDWLISVQNAGYPYVYPSVFDTVIPADESSLSGGSTAWTTGAVVKGAYISATYSNGNIQIAVTSYDPLAQ